MCVMCVCCTLNNCHSEMHIFNEKDQTSHTKMLTFYRREPFDLEASYKFPKGLPCSDPFIGKKNKH